MPDTAEAKSADIKPGVLNEIVEENSGTDNY